MKHRSFSPHATQKTGAREESPAPARFQGAFQFGMLTLSMAWMMPFDAWMSVLLTLAPFTVTTLPLRPRVNSLPETVFTFSPSRILLTADAERFPENTWERRMPFSFSLSL